MLTKDRTRESCRGLGNLEIRQVEPTEDTQFFSVGFLDNGIGVNIEDFRDEEEIITDDGCLNNVLTKNKVTRISAGLKQSSIEEINLLKEALGKIYAMRYWGKSHLSPERYQYYVINRAKISSSLSLPFKPGQRIIPFKAWALKQEELGYSIPEYFTLETFGKILLDGLQLWISPRQGEGYLDTEIFDFSGFQRNGVAPENEGTIWRTGTNPEYYLEIGEDTNLNFTNICNDDGVKDMIIELWTYPQYEDKGLVNKKVSNGGKGYQIWITNDGKLATELSDGSNSASINSNNAMAYEWNHCAVVIDRDDIMKCYVNGVVQSSTANVSGIESGENTEALKLQCGGLIGDFRIYQFPGGSLPENIDSIVANHYNAEKAFYTDEYIEVPTNT